MKRNVRPPAFRLPVTPDDVVRHALAAYYRAVGEAVAPIGEPDASNWSSPASFLDTLRDFFELRLYHEAAMAGHPVEADSARYLRWSATPAHAFQHIRDVDPGRWAELCIADPARLLPGAGAEPLRSAATDGCASAPGALPPASAVGPAPMPPEAADITVNESPLLAVPSMQKLPGVTPGDTLDQSGEKPA
jgi:hypothetical protein